MLGPVPTAQVLVGSGELTDVLGAQASSPLDRDGGRPPCGVCRTHTDTQKWATGTVVVSTHDNRGVGHSTSEPKSY